MAIKNFIPTIWNAAMLEEFRQAAVAAALTNRAYEGDAASGNKVKITTEVPVAVKDYKANDRKTTPDAVSTTQVELVIDQEKNFDFLIDDIDRRQVAGSLDGFARGAALGLVEDADKWILKQIADSVEADNQKTATSLADNGKAAWNVIRDLRTILSKAHTPVGGRVLVVNAEFEALLLGHDSKLTAVELAAGTPNGMRDAHLGRVLGFDVFVSENLPVVNTPQVLAFHRSAYAFVNQITETEAMRADDTFADRLRGLNVYGGKLIHPKAVASFTVGA